MKTIMLGELFQLKYGKSLRKDKRIQGNIPVFGSNGSVDYHNESLVQEPTIIVGRKGSIGEVHLVQTPCWPIDTTYFIDPLDKYEYDLEWLYRLLKTLRLQDLNRSAAIPGLNRDDVYRIKILLPPLDDQKRIASLLGKVEGAIAQRKQNLQELDDLLQSIFLEMFGDPVRNEKDWQTEKLGKIAVVERGRFSPRPRNDPKFYNGVYPFIQTGDISRSNGRLKNYTQTLNELGIKVSKEFKVGSIVIAIVGATIGETAILEISTYAPDSVIGITPNGRNSEIEAVFIEYILRFWKPVLRAKAPEAARANINIKTLQPLPIIRPRVDDKLKFYSISVKIAEIKFHYQQSLTDLECLYGALSQKAFKGELNLSRVPLTSEITETPEETHETDKQQTADTFAVPTPSNISSLNSVQERNRILAQWLTIWVDQLNGEPFSLRKFTEKVQEALLELANDDTQDFGIEDYRQVKTQIFEAIQSGQLEQTRNKLEMRHKQSVDDAPVLGNRVILEKVIAR